MEGFAEQKVPGGKLVSVKLEYGREITGIQILGDFFLHPEATIFKMEEALIGTSIEAGKEELAEKINRVIMSSNAELIGATPEAIADIIKMAVKR